jgi:hypothetical protein
MFKGDFLPAIDDVDNRNINPHALDYWTGFYSNRPMYKLAIREMFKGIRL